MRSLQLLIFLITTLMSFSSYLEVKTCINSSAVCSESNLYDADTKDRLCKIENLKGTFEQTTETIRIPRVQNPSLKCNKHNFGLQKLMLSKSMVCTTFSAYHCANFFVRYRTPYRLFFYLQKIIV